MSCILSFFCEAGASFVAVTQQEQTKPCEMSLEIEVEPEVVSKAFDEAYVEVGRNTEVPGFRKGKAPRAILERHVSEERVKERAADKLVKPAYEQALEQAGIEPFGTAEYEVVRLADAEPFVFKARVPLPPSVELGEYVGVEVERLVPQVSDEEVDRELEEIRQRSAEVENVESRPIRRGDLAVIRLTERDGDPGEKAVEVGRNLPSFDEGLVGMSAGETKTIELLYPEDYEDRVLAGTSSWVTVTVIGIKERHVPELTDEFVRQITENSDDKIGTVRELKDKIRSAMEEAASELADRQVEAKIVEKVVERSKICFPEAMLDHEVAHRLQDLLRDLESRKRTLEEYLESTGASFEQLRSRVEKSAERDLRASLVIGEIGRREDVRVSDEDVEAEVGKIAQESNLVRESFNAYLDKTDGRQAIRGRLLRRKVLDFLVHASNINNVGGRAS